MKLYNITAKLPILYFAIACFIHLPQAVAESNVSQPDPSSVSIESNDIIHTLYDRNEQRGLEGTRFIFKLPTSFNVNAPENKDLIEYLTNRTSDFVDTYSHLIVFHESDATKTLLPKTFVRKFFSEDSQTTKDSISFVFPLIGGSTKDYEDAIYILWSDLKAYVEAYLFTSGAPSGVAKTETDTKTDDADANNTDNNTDDDETVQKEEKEELKQDSFDTTDTSNDAPTDIPSALETEENVASQPNDEEYSEKPPQDETSLPSTDDLTTESSEVDASEDSADNLSESTEELPATNSKSDDSDTILSNFGLDELNAIRQDVVTLLDELTQIAARVNYDIKLLKPHVTKYAAEVLKLLSIYYFIKSDLVSESVTIPFDLVFKQDSSVETNHVSVAEEVLNRIPESTSYQSYLESMDGPELYKELDKIYLSAYLSEESKTNETEDTHLANFHYELTFYVLELAQRRLAIQNKLRSQLTPDRLLDIDDVNVPLNQD